MRSRKSDRFFAKKIRLAAVTNQDDLIAQYSCDTIRIGQISRLDNFVAAVVLQAADVTAFVCQVRIE
jgi:aspartate oxidase